MFCTVESSASRIVRTALSIRRAGHLYQTNHALEDGLRRVGLAGHLSEIGIHISRQGKSAYGARPLPPAERTRSTATQATERPPGRCAKPNERGAITDGG